MGPLRFDQTAAHFVPATKRGDGYLGPGVTRMVLGCACAYAGTINLARLEPPVERSTP